MFAKFFLLVKLNIKHTYVKIFWEVRAIIETNLTASITKILKQISEEEEDEDFKESIPPAYVAWRAITTNLFLLGS